MLITKIVTIKANRYVREYYTNKGYLVGEDGTTFEVNVDDLSKNSNVPVLVTCDFCKKELTMKYGKYLGSVETRNCCYDCRYEKVKFTNMKKYGVENTSQLQSVTDKRASTSMERYGVTSNLKLPETHEKVRKTNQEKYGADYYLLTKEGREKSKETNLIKYGFDNPAKNEEIKKKTKQSLYENGNCPTSKAQFYLHDLIGGELNYPFEYYNVDIFLKEYNIYIEYDGSGHNLNVKKKEITQEEFDRKSLIRYYYLKKKGLKMIQIINETDKLPMDEIILKDIREGILFLNNGEDSHIIINWDKTK